MNSTQEEALAALLREVTDAGYVFVAPTPETHRRVNARPGNEHARDLRGVFGWSRPFTRELVGDHLFALLESALALEPSGDRWKSRVRIATLEGRNYLHSAFPTIEADSVFFGPDTYRFVRAALAQLPDRPYGRAIDIGCGSGAGGLSVASARSIESLWLADINSKALSFARVNAVHQRRTANYAESDLLSSIDGAFDLILANPPYIADPFHRAYRDGGGPLGLHLSERIVRESIARLAPDGVLFLYTGVPIVDGEDPFRKTLDQISAEARCSVDYRDIDPDVFGEELENPAYRAVDRLAVISVILKRPRVP